MNFYQDSLLQWHVVNVINVYFTGDKHVQSGSEDSSYRFLILDIKKDLLSWKWK